MTVVARSALVPRPVQYMFDIVNDVEAYPRRFNWCRAAQIVEREAEHLTARLRVRYGGMETEFTTLNRIVPAQSIGLELVDGPFTRLRGGWEFTPLGEAGCRVGLRLDFELAGRFLGSALAVGFASLADRMVDDFVRVALESG